MDLSAGAAVETVLASLLHAHDDGEHRLGTLKIGHAQKDRAEAADLMRRGHRALFPGMRLARAAIVDEGQTLAFRILEMDREPTVTDLGAGMPDAMLAEPLRPIVESAFARDSERRAGD